MSHPLLQSYADTLQHDCPLILVLGREPNTSLPISNDHGCYNFDDYPRCAFWNVSYGVLAGTIEMSGAALKAHCRARRASPIVYADALPIGLKHAVANKQAWREQVSPEKIQAHIAAIFGYAPLLARVQVVIASGLEHKVFDPAREAIDKQCQVRNQSADHATKCYYLPFFFGNNAPHIREKITPELHDDIQRVLLAFLQPPH